MRGDRVVNRRIVRSNAAVIRRTGLDVLLAVSVEISRSQRSHHGDRIAKGIRLPAHGRPVGSGLSANVIRLIWNEPGPLVRVQSVPLRLF